MSDAVTDGLRQVLNANGLPGGVGVLDGLEKRIAELEAERDRLKEALTPSCETKAAYMGEFRMNYPMFDEDGEDYDHLINVPWTTIKEIMAAISERAEGNSK